jgi:hypothetical protein
MTIRESANQLRAHLSTQPWLTAVGVGQENRVETIVLYVKSLKQAEVAFLKDGWHGFPLVVRKMTPPGPLSGNRSRSHR